MASDNHLTLLHLLVELAEFVSGQNLKLQPQPASLHKDLSKWDSHLSMWIWSKIRYLNWITDCINTPKLTKICGLLGQFWHIWVWPKIPRPCPNPRHKAKRKRSLLGRNHTYLLSKPSRMAEARWFPLLCDDFHSHAPVRHNDKKPEAEMASPQWKTFRTLKWRYG